MTGILVSGRSIPATEASKAAAVYDGFDELDAFGPYEVLGEAGFDVALVTHPATARIATARGAVVVPHRRDIITAGGVTSGLDLALGIVEQEKGREAADDVAAEIEHRRDERIWRTVAR
jgi:putative intracellular protease/amidase